MSLSIDPKFQKWFDSRKVAQHLATGIPTRNANPTRKAGPKNSTGKGPKGNSKKTVVKAHSNSNANSPRVVTEKANLNVVKTGVKKLSRITSISRPRGKY